MDIKIGFPCFLFLLTILIPPSKLMGQIFTYRTSYEDGLGGVDGLDGPYGVVVSPDDQHVYTASSTDDAICVFEQDGSGGLNLVETHKDDSQVGGSIDGLDGAKRLCISPDGKHIYVPSTTDDALVVFSRNASTGELTYVETHHDGVGGVDGLDGAFEAVVSPDNLHVYVASITDDAVAVFSRNTTTGSLTFVEIQKDGTGSITLLNSCRSVLVSGDGKHLYAAASLDDAIVYFDRNPTTGALTFVGEIEDDVSGIDGLDGAYSLAMSGDDQYLYSVGSTDDAISVFSRNSTTGALSFQEVHIDDSQLGSIPSINVPRKVLVAPNDAYVYIASSSDDAVTVFSRNLSTGLLTYEEQFIDAIGGVDGLDGAYCIAVTSTNMSLYTVGLSDDALAVLDRNIVLPANELKLEGNLNQYGGISLQWYFDGAETGAQFWLERSLDGQNFLRIASLEISQGGEGPGFQLEDLSPWPGDNFYRLQHIGLDGTIQSSNLLHMRVELWYEDEHFHLQIQPNPCLEQCMVQLRGVSLPDHTMIQWELIGLDGRSVGKGTEELISGEFLLGEEEISLQRGVYLLLLRYGQRLEARQLWYR